jgi:biotin carboxyl carrier protein
MKLRVTIEGKDCLLELDRQAGAYRSSGAIEASGTVSLEEVMPGMVSVLLGDRSYHVQVVAKEGEYAAWVAGRRYTITAADLRDPSPTQKRRAAAGPFELKAQMPGKVVKLLVHPGALIASGQSLIVVEAMKMQNEMKSPKDGVVRAIYAAEGATVAAGERLMVVE